jgi:Bifunctional DNA primase/polymerase, N-terminal
MLLVIDVDPRAFRWFRTSIRRLPETRIHRTPRGGYDLVYRLPLPPAPLLGSSASRLAPGVDTHGQGGYVIWPPSRGYEVVYEAEVARLPKWILRRLTVEPRRSARRRAQYVSHGQQRLEALANFVVHSRQGEPNERTFWAACRAGEVVSAGKIGEHEAMAAIAHAAMATGLDAVEAWQTAKGGVQQRGRTDTSRCAGNWDSTAVTLPRKGPTEAQIG